MKKKIDKIISLLPEKQRDIIISRFGLYNKPKKTLASLGKKYNITRERVRQIEEAVLKQLRKDFDKISDIKKTYDKYVSMIKNTGGVKRCDLFVGDIKNLSKNTDEHKYISLLFSVFKSPNLFGENSEFYSFWYLTKKDLDRNKDFVKKFSSVLDKKKSVAITKDGLDKIFKEIIKTYKFTEEIALNLAKNSKKFVVSVYGDFGLSRWPEIKPKTIRDKSFLVIKKHGKELHFRDIANHINNIKFDAKKAHPQTVHNELIKDSRFVLVGRGLYSLCEFGIEPGTTTDILRNMLKKNGPMHVDEIIKFVSEQRILRKNTILINLQNKKLFKKLEGNRYHIA